MTTPTERNMPDLGTFVSPLTVIAVKWSVVVGREEVPEWVELTMANGWVIRYRPETTGAFG
jgi:hypothetical protein